jgi:ubiquinone biosynthesis protein
VQELVVEEVHDLLPVLRKLPRRLERLLASVEAGQVSVNFRIFAKAEDRRTVTAWLHQTLLTVLAAAAGLMAVMLLGNENGPALTAEFTLYQFFGLSLLLIASVMALRVLADIFTRRSRQD